MGVPVIFDVVRGILEGPLGHMTAAFELVQ